MEKLDCIIIGAGVVGLAVARELALAGREVIVLEAAGAIGTETSSRNSEVIHAGLYYPPGSLKARLCVEGKQQLYAYCAERGVEARPIGKLLVAASEAQVPKLAAIKENAERNGVGFHGRKRARSNPRCDALRACFRRAPASWTVTPSCSPCNAILRTRVASSPSKARW